MARDPLACPKCRARFERSALLQAEIRHIAMTVSPGAAEAELRERLDEDHVGHR